MADLQYVISLISVASLRSKLPACRLACLGLFMAAGMQKKELSGVVPAQGVSHLKP